MQEAQSGLQHARKQDPQREAETLHTPNNLTHGVDNLYRNTPHRKLYNHMNFSARRALVAAAVSVSLAATAAPAATAQSSLPSLPSGLVSVNGTGIENGAFTGAIEKDGIKIPVTGTIENGAITGLKVDPNGVVGIA